MSAEGNFTMEESRTTYHPFVSNNDKFISWQSVTLLIVFFWFLRASAAPFIPPGEARRAASSSYYYSVLLFLYVWVVFAATLTIVPHFSSHYNVIIAAALFFPMTFATLGVQLVVRFFTRVAFYFSVKSGVLSVVPSGEEKIRVAPVGHVNQIRDTKGLKMIPFHRPFRKLVKSAVILSALLSLLYAHCWSRSLSAFKVHADDGAGPICRVIFFPFKSELEKGVDENCIWILWGLLVLFLLISYTQDEFLGFHCEAKSPYFSLSLWSTLKRGEEIGKVDDDNDTVMAVKYLYDNEGPNAKIRSDSFGGISDITSSLRVVARHTFCPKSVEGPEEPEEPEDTLPMVPWLSLLGVSTCIDIVLQLKVFLGRFDARSMQAASRHRPFCSSKLKSNRKSEHNDAKTEFDNLKEFYPGCIFDYSAMVERPNSDGFWFDFMADCGDGFNSSYQVARMLAQQSICVKGQESKISLPRGEFLVIGGDLAYPDPTRESFEKRFFRTFEDAMSPPLSFRRSNVATKKNKDFEAHKGPSTFIIPGNHDWYDGLATFTRFILCRNWLGGWLMPQERSYFTLKLPHGWWIFGMDCALCHDIDIDQYKFFADVAQHQVGVSDAVIIVTHEPHWVTDFDAKTKVDDLSEVNIRELTNTHLRGKVRARLAGDLHHYTRHVPVTRSHQQCRNPKRSLSFDGKSQTRRCVDQNDTSFEPFMEENKPELIVSGGGGAFLHGTHTFSKHIKVGENQNEYTRVCAFPSAKVSHRIAWFNIWHFRWRNWRFDIVWAVIYLGLVYSLFPLCGIYADYESFNPSHNPILLPIWSFQKVFTLMWRIIIHERVSLIFCSITITGCLVLQAGEIKMRPVARFLWGLCLAFAHITAALTCLLFVESLAEWAAEYGIVNASPHSGSLSAGAADGINLASSLYNEYTTHFSHLFVNFTEADPNKLTHRLSGSASSGVLLFSYLYRGWKLIKNFPLLTTTMELFDLPGSIRQNHQDMCSRLCSEGTECLLMHDPAQYLSIGRTTFVPYLAAIGLYFIFLAVPIAGGIFGTWIALSMNVFSVQTDLGFSSLQLQHWKNYLKLHVKENGDIEIFAIGLNRVPTRWIKDPQWRSRNENDSSIPSWAWQRPSKWIALDEHLEKYTPVIVDSVRVRKRRISPVLPENNRDVIDPKGQGSTNFPPCHNGTKSRSHGSPDHDSGIDMQHGTESEQLPNRLSFTQRVRMDAESSNNSLKLSLSSIFKTEPTIENTRQNQSSLNSRSQSPTVFSTFSGRLIDTLDNSIIGVGGASNSRCGSVGIDSRSIREDNEVTLTLEQRKKLQRERQLQALKQRVRRVQAK